MNLLTRYDLFNNIFLSEPDTNQMIHCHLSSLRSAPERIEVLHVFIVISKIFVYRIIYILTEQFMGMQSLLSQIAIVAASLPSITHWASSCLFGNSKLAIFGRHITRRLDLLPIIETFLDISTTHLCIRSLNNSTSL